MTKIADKHGLTNRYRSYGSKRVVKRGRPRKYLFGAPRRKRKTYKRSYSYARNTSYASGNVAVDANNNATTALIAFFVILLILFSLISIFRCFIPIIIGTGILFIVDDKCKKAWELPTGRWSKPASIGWTILTIFAMLTGFVVVLLIQIANIPFIPIVVLALVYAGLSFLILHRKHKKVKTKTNSNTCEGKYFDNVAK